MKQCFNLIKMKEKIRGKNKVFNFFLKSLAFIFKITIGVFVKSKFLPQLSCQYINAQLAF